MEKRRDRMGTGRVTRFRAAPAAGKVAGPFLSPEDGRRFRRLAMGLGAAFAVILALATGLTMLSPLQAVRDWREAVQGGDLGRAVKPLLASLMVLPLGLGLLAALQAGMDRHRPPKGRLAGRPVEYASLWRRLAGRVVDGLLALLGMAAGTLGGTALLLWRWRGRAGVPGLQDLAWPLAAGTAGLLGVTGVLLWWEGRSGRSPGRLLAGTRILGTDLRPCGLRRILWRSVVGLVDGLGLGAVGLYTVSFSARYQRLADRMADTVVLREPRPGPGPRPGDGSGPAFREP